MTILDSAICLVPQNVPVNMESAVLEQLGFVEMAVNVDIYGSTSGKFGELEHTLADTENGCRKVR